MFDIAGGAGGLSYELCVRYGVNSTLLDNRESESRLSSMQRRRMKKICKKRERPDSSPSLESTYLPKNETIDRSPLIDWLTSCTDLAVQDDGIVLEKVRDSVSSSSALPFTHMRHEFPIRFDESTIDPDLLKLLESASVLVGVHSDQATESIIDAALRLNMPFAVVPCCVFPHLFPERRFQAAAGVRDGNKGYILPPASVISYEEFIDYLLQKDGSIMKDFLPFVGRNVVLYRLPAGSDPRSSMIEKKSYPEHIKC